jgi:hypothetical protein
MITDISIILFCCFYRDNVPTIELATWPMEASLFEGETTAGPLPVCFSEDPDSSVEALFMNTKKCLRGFLNG